MRKLAFITIVCALVATPAMADYFAGVDNLSQTGVVGAINYSSGGGGEFTIDDSALSIAAYAGTTSGIKGVANSFQTFCVEVSEFTASPVDVVVSTTFINELTGAVTGPGSHAVMGSKPKGDNLDPKTAYLYTQFAKGVLSSYDYLNAGVGRNVSAGELQEAIWKIEQEIATADGQAATWIAEAQTAIDNLTWSGIGNVRILNLYALGTYGTTHPVLKQDQLYLVPVPGAVLLGMLGLSVAGLKLRKHA